MAKTKNPTIDEVEIEETDVEAIEELDEVEETNSLTPKALAEELDVSPKTLRGWLRRQFPRGDAHGKSWVLTEDQAEAARVHFLAEDEDEDDESETEDEG